MSASGIDVDACRRAEDQYKVSAGCLLRDGSPMQPGQLQFRETLIDLDLLVHGDARLEVEGLMLPHPGIPERDFVLYPLFDVAPHLAIPVFGVVRDLVGRVTNRGVQRL